MYSQNDEEYFILQACMGSSIRRLLDIGAWDPEDKSNSRALIEAGWGGVLVEPSPGPLRALVSEYDKRTDVAVLSGAVTIGGGLLNLQITDDAVSAETGTDHVKLWANHTKYIGRLWVQSFTIAQILETFGSFDFVNIDAEGISVDLLKALIATEMFPRCICVEHDGRIVEAMKAARERGYVPIHETQENLIFGR